MRKIKIVFEVGIGAIICIQSSKEIKFQNIVVVIRKKTKINCIQSIFE